MSICPVSALCSHLHDLIYLLTAPRGKRVSPSSLSGKESPNPKEVAEQGLARGRSDLSPDLSPTGTLPRALTHARVHILIHTVCPGLWALPRGCQGLSHVPTHFSAS